MVKPLGRGEIVDIQDRLENAGCSRHCAIFALSRRAESSTLSLVKPVRPVADALALQVERRIYLIRGEKVMLDYELAELYSVETRALKQAVRRNSVRFPIDFMFELTADETGHLVSQNVIPTRSKFGGAAPMAFTEQGVAMLSSVLRSPRAVQVNIAIMRAFVRLREMLLSNADLARKLNALEAKYDEQFRIVFDAIRELMIPPPATTKCIGFHKDE